jgi:NADH:ubiquinone reductase (non-electrogenic)
MDTKSATLSIPAPSSEQPRVVVLGTGFASFSLLKEIDTDLFAVTAISPRNYFLFTPLLPGTTVGTIEFRSIIEPIRKACPDIHYYQAACTGVDPTGRTITCEALSDKRRFTVAYDVLVIGIGAVSSTYGIPGVKEHALFLKDLGDARAIRQRIIERFEQAASPAATDEERKQLLHFVVVGGGPTGVEFAAEMHDFLREDLETFFPRLAPFVNITLLEAMNQILNAFDQTLSAYTMKLFQRNRIQVRTGSFVARVENDKVILRDDSQIPCGLVVWSTGVGPTDLAAALPFPKDQASRLLIDRYFLVNGTTDVYAMGDCATIEGMNLPATSQVAQQQGRYLARHLRRSTKHQSTRPFRYRHFGMLAYVGSNKALADLAAIKGKGFSTWLFWRSAYITKLVSLKNKMLVLFDWFKTFVFGRDISRF